MSDIPQFPGQLPVVPNLAPGGFQQAQGQSFETAKLLEFLKVGTVNASNVKAALATLDSLTVTDLTVTNINGLPTPGQWKPYPAGTYVFPSGNQTVAEGVLAIGAITTAPTLGTVTIKKAWYKDNGNKTADIMFSVTQTSNAGAANGTGLYLIPLPLGMLIDSSIVQLGTTLFDGSNIGLIGGIITGYQGTFAFKALSTSTLYAAISYTGIAQSSNGWGVVFRFADTATVQISGIMASIPIV